MAEFVAATANAAMKHGAHAGSLSDVDARSQDSEWHQQEPCNILHEQVMPSIVAGQGKVHC